MRGNAFCIGGYLDSEHHMHACPYHRRPQRVSGCAHQQAEPVILSTGELVACVCINCYAQLPDTYIVTQRTRAEREAHCQHADLVEMTKLGQAERSYLCVECGAYLIGEVA